MTARSSFVTCLVLTSFVASTGSATPLDVQVELERDTLRVGEPLIAELHVTNHGPDVGPFVLYSSDFTRTYYSGVQQTGCHIEISVPYPIPGPGPKPAYPPLFGFSWDFKGLLAGETASCRLLFPATLYPGTETIELVSMLNGLTAVEANFTYTVTPRVVAPRPVPASSILALLMLGIGVLAASAIGTRSRSC